MKKSRKTKKRINSSSNDEPPEQRQQQKQEEEEGRPIKRQKVFVNEEIRLPSSNERPKSKKDLRKERKAALKAKLEEEDQEEDGSDPVLAADVEEKPTRTSNKKKTMRKKEEEEAALRRRQKAKEERREERRLKKQDKERALDARFEEQNRIRKERDKQQQKQLQETSYKDNEGHHQHEGKDSNKKKKKKNKQLSKDGDGKPTTIEPRKESSETTKDDYSIYRSIFKSSIDATGMTHCRLDVKFSDIQVGTGNAIIRSTNKNLVVIKYQLRGGGENGVLIDSSKNFKFRIGKGEVIQGLEIGLEGMRVGGIRHLIIPPKAGYGSQDIGAGPGAILHFVVWVLQIY